MGKKEKLEKFIYHVTDRLKHDQYCINDDRKLRKVFKKVAEKLPADLRCELKSNRTENFSLFKRLMSGITTERQANYKPKSPQDVQQQYMLYLAEKCYDRNIEGVQLLKLAQKISVPECRRNLKSLRWLYHIEVLCRVVGESSHFWVIRKIMHVFTVKLIETAETIISDENVNRCKMLREETATKLHFFHHKHNTLSQQGESEKPYYADLMCAILSTYCDQIVTISRDATERELASYRCHLSLILHTYTPHSSDHAYVCDVLLQMNCMDQYTDGLLLPIISQHMCKIEVLSHVTYTKYICLVRRLRDVYGDKAAGVYQNALKTAALKNYMSFLERENSEILEDLPITRRFKGRKITQYLLQEADDDVITKLQDILTDNPYDDIEIERNNAASQEDMAQCMQEVEQVEPFVIQKEIEDGMEQVTSSDLYFIDDGTTVDSDSCEMAIIDSTTDEEDLPTKIHTTEDIVYLNTEHSTQYVKPKKKKVPTATLR